jgi:hypothetical protein
MVGTNLLRAADPDARQATLGQTAMGRMILRKTE